MSPYRYTECGLDNVIIEGISAAVDDAGDEVISIPNIVGLHRAIAEGIVLKPSSISGPELRFLRTELGLTQAQLGRILQKEAQTIARWEKSETPFGAADEVLIRQLANEKLELGLKLSVERISELCIPGTAGDLLNIDGSDPEHYRPMNRAA